MSRTPFRLTALSLIMLMGAFSSCESIKKQRCERCPEFTETSNKVDVKTVQHVVYNEEK